MSEFEMQDIPVDTERALATVRERIERERIVPVRRAPAAARTAAAPPWLKGLAAAASVVVVATALTVTGVALVNLARR